MAGCDYKYCDVCDTKAYYDTDVNYQECQVMAICKECSKKWGLIIVDNDGKEFDGELIDIKRE